MTGDHIERLAGPAVLNSTLALRRPPAIVMEQSSDQLCKADSAGVGPPNIDFNRVVVARTPVTRSKLVGAIQAALGQRNGNSPTANG